MKVIIGLMLLWCTVAVGQELRRPSSETIAGFCGANSQPMAQAHDSAGQSTSSTITATASISCNQFGCTESTVSLGRTFTNWAAPSFTYSSVTLNIAASSPGWQNTSGTGGGAWLYYSLNGGGTWTQIIADSGTGWALQTFTIPLSTSQDFTKLRVAACVTGNSGGNSAAGQPPPTPGVDSITISDIWTLGVGVGQGAGTGSSAGKRHNTVIIN